jgi:hypothetical protein
LWDTNVQVLYADAWERFKHTTKKIVYVFSLFLDVLIELNELTTVLFRMSMFISKHPSTCPRVLDATDYPPHNIIHDTQKYPLFYDALYYPQYNESVYAIAEKFCCWL